MNTTQPLPPSYNLYEELPEPVYREMKDKEKAEEQKKTADMVNAYFIILKNQDK